MVRYLLGFTRSRNPVHGRQSLCDRISPMAVLVRKSMCRSRTTEEAALEMHEMEDSSVAHYRGSARKGGYS